MKCYFIWAIDLPEETDTADRDRYLQCYPKAPQYQPFYLFPANSNDVINLKCDVVDLSAKALVETVANNKTEMTFSAFDTLADELISAGFTGRCVVLNVQQGQYLHLTRYTQASIA